MEVHVSYKSFMGSRVLLSDKCNFPDFSHGTIKRSHVKYNANYGGGGGIIIGTGPPKRPSYYGKVFNR
uniref:Ovule protein n=1 Tax=Caenorhabditis tropicalis TaxID=1561998 RepID=A0A1I7UH17_9PELO